MSSSDFIKENNVIDGTAISNHIRENLKQEIEKMDNTPFLVSVLVGTNPASQTYVKYKEKACNKIGIDNKIIRLPENSTQKEVEKEIQELNQDPNVNGILLQLPLPEHLDPNSAILAIDPEKDVDGLHYENVGKLHMEMETFIPCTANGIMRILEYCDVEIEGKDAVVVGRSNLVGRPVSKLLEGKNATVTLCHSRTKNLEEKTRGADILVAAVGVKEMITSDMVTEGTVIIDVGINRSDDGLKGDVEFDTVKTKAELITPVPGGVGPLTISMLLSNTVKAQKHQNL